MKKETGLKIGLMLLGVALSIGPFIAAFAVNDWDLQKAFLPDQEDIASIQNNLTGLFGGSENSGSTTTLENVSVSDSTVTVQIQFTSPFGFAMKFKNMSVALTDQGAQIAQVAMQSPVDVPARGTKRITLTGTFSGGMLPVNPQFESGSMTVEVYGVTITLQLSSGGLPT
ncbi:MAG: hypothetical protein AB1476_05180 [Candidatus Hadarchaeota archaeon]